MTVGPFERQLQQILGRRPILPGQQQRGSEQARRTILHEFLEGHAHLLIRARSSTYLTLWPPSRLSDSDLGGSWRDRDRHGAYRTQSWSMSAPQTGLYRWLPVRCEMRSVSLGVTVGSQIARLVSWWSSRAHRAAAAGGSVVCSWAARAICRSRARLQSSPASVVACPLPGANWRQVSLPMKSSAEG